MSSPEPRLPGADPTAPGAPVPRVAVVPDEPVVVRRPEGEELLREMAEPARPAANVAVAAGEPATAPAATTASASAVHSAVPTAVPEVMAPSDDDAWDHTVAAAGADVAGDEDLRYEDVPTGWRGRPKGKLKARRVRRVVRYVSPWSVFKVSVLFSICLWLILTVAGVILWQAAVASGMVTNVEKFLAKLLAEESFTIDGRELFRASAIAGVMLVFAGSAFTVLMSLLFNVISDITGGIRFTVLELEDTVRELRVPVGGEGADLVPRTVADGRTSSSA